MLFISKCFLVSENAHYAFSLEVTRPKGNCDRGKKTHCAILFAMEIQVYTDGSSRGNPGPGGWGALIAYNLKLEVDSGNATTKILEIGGREVHTTNNRMELMAIRESLSLIEARKLEGDVRLFTDSAYAMNGLLGWMYGWEKNGWKTKTGDEVLNQDLWRDLLGLVFRMKQGRAFDIEKVKGHSGHALNERVDAIATAYADGERVLLFSGGKEQYEKLQGFSLEARGKSEDSKEETTKKSSSSKKAYSYVSCVDGEIHADPTWALCEKRVKGKKGAKYKKVFSKEEETMVAQSFQKE